jgi:hypothetical protein
MNIKTKLELHQLAIKLVDSIAYDKPISEIKSIINDLSTRFKNDPELREQENLNSELNLEKELINQ